MKTIRRTVEQLRTLHEIKHFRESPYEARRLDTPDEVQQARQMLAGLYLRKGAIDESFINEQGTLKDEFDPYYPRATYFGTFDRDHPGELLATARLIHPDSDEGIDSLQLHIDELEPEWQVYLRDQEDPSRFAEFASLVKQPETGSMPTLFLIREMLHYSQANRINWVCGLKPELEKSFKCRFGDALQPMGDQVHLGDLKPVYLPFSIDTEKGLEQLTNDQRLIRPLGRKAMVAFMSDGLVQQERTTRRVSLRYIIGH